MVRLTAAGGLLALILSVGCTGTIDDGRGSSPSRPGDPSGPGAPGGTPGTPVTPGAPAGPGAPGVCKGSGTPTPARLWRLTHTQVKNTIYDTFGVRVPVLDTLPAESRLDGYANAAERLGLSSVLLAYYDRGADAVADEVVKRSMEFVKCPMSGLGQGTCLADFLRVFGQKAWRRPLSDVELGKLDKLYRAAAPSSPEDGLKMVVKGLLLSANFLFRSELGSDQKPGATTTLTDVELASALSYTFWDAPPDATLMDLAVAGKLHEAATLKGQAQRLFASSTKAPAAMFSFMQQWLETEDLTTEPKDPMVFPAFTPQVARDLEEETRRFVSAVVFDGGGDRNLRTLLTASQGYLSAATAPIYGASAAGAGLNRAELDRTQRRGLFTQAGFLAAHAEPINTSVVGRGRYLREQVLCAPVPPPPGDFKFDEKVITDDMTAREKFAVHSKNPACASCHALFDVIGFALENYDAIGQFRTKDKGKPIDPSGVLPLPSGGELRFTSFVDMLDQIAAGPDVYGCFASQYLQYLSGKVRLDDCEREEITRAFVASGYKLDELAMAIVTSPRFITRRN
jgi:hypothetical protein